jgi:hypothetical protein
MNDLVLSKEAIEALLNFAGYGNPRGDFWFIGMEKAGILTHAELTTRAEEFERIDDSRPRARAAWLSDGYSQADTHVVGDVPPGAAAASGSSWVAGSRDLAQLPGASSWATRRRHVPDRIVPLPAPSTASWPYQAIFPSRAE